MGLSLNHSWLSRAELTPASPAHPGLTSAPRLCSEFVRAEIDVYTAHTERTPGGPAAWPEEEEKEEESGYVSPGSGGITRHPLSSSRRCLSCKKLKDGAMPEPVPTRGGDRAGDAASQPSQQPWLTPKPPCPPRDAEFGQGSPNSSGRPRAAGRRLPVLRQTRAEAKQPGSPCLFSPRHEAYIISPCCPPGFAQL